MQFFGLATYWHSGKESVGRTFEQMNRFNDEGHIPRDERGWRWST